MTPVPTPRQVLVRADARAAAQEAAHRFIGSATEAARARGRFLVALSGGTTPRLLYQLLRGRPEAVPWRDAHMFWSDEHWTPPGTRSPNHRLAEEELLSHVPVPPAQVHPVAGPSPERAAETAEKDLRAAARDPNAVPVLDLVILGLGADGHTASLFPGGPDLANDPRLYAAVRGPPSSPDRVTATPALLNAARELLFLVTGPEKAPAVQAALEHGRGPAGALRPRGQALWILDPAAASQTSRSIPETP